MDTARPRINYSLIASAITHYIYHGFDYIEVPWVVDENHARETFKAESKFVTPAGWLVGSAEQGFIELMKRGLLDDKKCYVTASPCFRDETEDKLHSTSFMKVELFSLTDQRPKFIDLAQKLFSQLGIETHTTIITEDSTDLVDNNFNIELGSYNIYRNGNSTRWSCGTGLAEPRFSTVLKW